MLVLPADERLRGPAPANRWRRGEGAGASATTTGTTGSSGEPDLGR